jgi:hypothetical protein
VVVAVGMGGAVGAPARATALPERSLAAQAGRSPAAATPESQAAAVVPGAPKGVRAKRVSSTSLAVSWKPVSGADGYRVMRWDAKAKAYRAAKTLNGAAKTTWTDKGLDSRKVVKYTVRSYAKTGAAKTWGPDSIWVSARTSKPGDKKTNAAKVIAPKTLSLGLLETRAKGDVGWFLGDKWQTYSPRPVAAKTAKVKHPKVIDTKLRYTIADPTLVQVLKGGRLRAQNRTGTTKLTITAHDGVRAVVTIKVKDYAAGTPRFDPDVAEDSFPWTPEAKAVDAAYRGTIAAIFSYFLHNPVTGNVKFRRDANGNLVNNGGLDVPPDITAKILTVMAYPSKGVPYMEIYNKWRYLAIGFDRLPNSDYPWMPADENLQWSLDYEYDYDVELDYLAPHWVDDDII